MKTTYNFMKLVILITAFVFSTFSVAQSGAWLVAQWKVGNEQFCKYSNGTVLNVGLNFCPWTL